MLAQTGVTSSYTRLNPTSSEHVSYASLNTLLTPDPPHRVPAAFYPLHE